MILHVVRAVPQYAGFFPEFVLRSVRQGVHRRDDDRLHSPARAPAENVVDDRDHVGEAFPGASAGGQNAIGASLGVANRLLLVLMEAQRTTAGIGGIVLAENPGAALERRVELNEGLRPEDVTIEALVNISSEVFVLDVNEATDIPGLIVDEAVPRNEMANAVSTLLPSR